MRKAFDVRKHGDWYYNLTTISQVCCHSVALLVVVKLLDAQVGILEFAQILVFLLFPSLPLRNEQRGVAVAEKWKDWEKFRI